MHRAILVFFMTIFSHSIAAKDIFIHSHNSISNRLAIFEDDEKIAFLYLTKPGTQKPEKDAVAYSRVALVDKIDWSKTKKTGEVPMLSRDVASSSAVITNPKESEFSFKWSSDGNAVALIRNGTPIAFVSTSDILGYSRAIAKTSHLANIWNQKRYETLFNN